MAHNFCHHFDFWPNVKVDRTLPNVPELRWWRMDRNRKCFWHPFVVTSNYRTNQTVFYSVVELIEEHSSHWLKPFIPTNGAQSGSCADGSTLKCSMDLTSSVLCRTKGVQCRNLFFVHKSGTEAKHWSPDDFGVILDSNQAGGGCGGGVGRALPAAG